jgi:hypothetical protein
MVGEFCVGEFCCLCWVLVGRKPSQSRVSFVRLGFPGAHSDPEIVPEGPLPTRSHFIRGPSPHAGKEGVLHYERVRYRELYDGIDLLHYGNDGKLQFDLEVKPGADPAVIRLEVEGAGEKTTEENGDLVLSTAACELRPQIPAGYQDPLRDGNTCPAPSGWMKRGWPISRSDSTMQIGPW